MPHVHTVAGRTGSFIAPTTLVCAFPAPTPMASAPSVTIPWREIDPSYWCGQWSDTGQAAQGPQGDPGPVGAAGPAGNSAVYGTATIDFGTAPTTDGAVAVTYQTPIAAGAHIRAWIQDDPVAAELVTLTPETLVPGSGFAIYAACLGAKVTGTIPVHWTWNP